MHTVKPSFESLQLYLILTLQVHNDSTLMFSK